MIDRRRPLLLDLFCCEGGAAVGYHRAGFDVIGVDCVAQPLYPFPMVIADALAPPFDLTQFDAIHASPPCQAYSTMGNRSRGEHPDLLGATIDMLRATGVPFVVENVPGAARLMATALVLTGGQFGLGVHRPRHFASSELLMALPKAKPPKHGVGVYGVHHDGRWLWQRRSGDPYRAANSLGEARDAMGMEWASWHGCTQAVPPAYTEYIGGQLLAMNPPS